MGAGLAAKEFDRQQDTSARMSLEEHSARLKAELQDRQNEWQGKENVAQRDVQTRGQDLQHVATVSGQNVQMRGQDMTAQTAKESNESAERRTAMSEGGANSRAAMSNTIAQQQVDISRATAQYNQSISPEVKMELEGIQKQIEIEKRALDAIKPMDDPDGTKAKPIMDRILQMQREQQALFQNVRQQGPLGEANVRGRGNPRSIGFDPNRQ
jgi:hypothetical protein